MILLPPEAPTAISTPWFPITSAGDMLFKGYLPDEMEFTLPGTGSYHIMPLFMMTPEFLGMIPDPNPDIMVFVMETAFPSLSITAKCVVPVSGDGLLPVRIDLGFLPSSFQLFPGFYFSGACWPISCLRRIA